MEYEWYIIWPDESPVKCSLNLLIRDDYEGPIIHAVNNRTGNRKDFFARKDTREIEWAELAEFSGGVALTVYPYNQVNGRCAAPDNGQAAPVVISQPQTDWMMNAASNVKAARGDFAILLRGNKWIITLVTDVNQNGKVTAVDSIPIGRSITPYDTPNETVWIVKADCPGYSADREGIRAAIMKLHPVRRGFKTPDDVRAFLLPFITQK